MTEGESMEEGIVELRVRKVAQAASGGSHVTIYEAEVELVPDGCVRVEIAGVYPPDTPPDAVEVARQAIRRGAESVLWPTGSGAIIRVRRIVIHAVDFHTRRFEQYTAEEMSRLLRASVP